MKVRFYAYGILILGLTGLLASCKKPTSSPSKAWVVSTLAGSGDADFANGTGAAAKFNDPYGVAVDSDGNVYVADTDNHRIRKITAGGKVSVLAGDGEDEHRDGTGTEAKFDLPASVAVDSNGIIYVADENNNRIRKITIDSSGVEVSTLAGSDTSGVADGASAQFDHPNGVAVASDGIVYVADTDNHRIRKITAEGVVSTLAGSTQGHRDGGTAEAQFDHPHGVAVDSNGNIYVADGQNHRIRKITKAGVVSTLAGGTQGYKDGTGTAAQFYFPRGVAVDSGGNVYVADRSNHRIRKITAEGVVTTLAGSGTQGYRDGGTAEAQFHEPYGVAVDSNGTVYVADKGNHRIRKIEYKVP